MSSTVIVDYRTCRWECTVFSCVLCAVPYFLGRCRKDNPGGDWIVFSLPLSHCDTVTCIVDRRNWLKYPHVLRSTCIPF